MIVFLEKKLIQLKAEYRQCDCLFNNYSGKMNNLSFVVFLEKHYLCGFVNFSGLNRKCFESRKNIPVIMNF